MPRAGKRFNVWKKAARGRKRMPQWEQYLLVALRRHGFVVCHQQVMLPYICDFYLPEQNVVIELDGQHHRSRKRVDEVRDRVLVSTYGVLEVVRIWNIDLESAWKPLLLKLRSLPRERVAVPLAGSVSRPL